nr:DUF2267 domain-containing protein [Halolamina sp. CBA1230]
MGTAVRNTRAVLTTLGERLQADEAEDLASPLPGEVSYYLLDANSGQGFDHAVFLERVAERAGVDEGEAKIRAQAIVALVGDVVPGGEIDDVEDGLPDDYAPLFEFVDAEETPW